MKNDLTELVFILDKSGSMSGLELDTIGGFNSLISKQRKEKGEARVSTVLFNHEVEFVHDGVSLEKIKKLTDKDYCVSGCTALLDAIGTSINHVLKKHKKSKKEDIPSKTMFVITTDGLENSSKEYSYTTLKKLIEKMKKEREWEFIFLGANIDAAKEAGKFGIDENNAVNYKCDKKGIALNYECISSAISSIRKDKKMSSSWRSKIDADVENR